MSSLLGITKQNCYRYVKELLSHKLIEVDRIEGKNKFFKLNTDIKSLTLVAKGQMSFDIK
jgi:predicted transcriptional regulator